MDEVSDQIQSSDRSKGKAKGKRKGPAEQGASVESKARRIAASVQEQRQYEDTDRRQDNKVLKNSNQGNEHMRLGINSINATYEEALLAQRYGGQEGKHCTTRQKELSKEELIEIHFGKQSCEKFNELLAP